MIIGFIIVYLFIGVILTGLLRVFLLTINDEEFETYDFDKSSIKIVKSLQNRFNTQIVRTSILCTLIIPVMAFVVCFTSVTGKILKMLKVKG